MRRLAMLRLAVCLAGTVVLASDDTAPWFVDVTADVGLELAARTDHLADGFVLPEIMGSGLAVFDFDADGQRDILLVRAADDRPRLFKNDLKRTGRFVDASARLPSIADLGLAMGAAVGDVDNDGDLDLFLSGFGLARLWLNDAGRFFDASVRLEAFDPVWGTSSAFCDLDGDGDLDLVVASYVRADSRSCPNAAGEAEFCPPNAFPPLHDTVLENLGDGTFRAQAVGGTPRAGLGLVCFDVDGDGAIEIAVANDGHPNQLWELGGDWRDQAFARGFAVNFTGEEEAGMGVALGDLQNDGSLDLFVTHIDVETNTLWLGEGGRFFDETSRLGLASPSVGLTGFGVSAFDADLDGDLDLAIANGKVRRRVGAARSVASYAETNLLLENRNGRFRPRCLNDAFCSHRDVARGLVARDMDGDGDLDLVTSDNAGRVRLYRNETAPSHWLGIRAWDPALRRDAIGALVRVNDRVRQSRPVLGGTSYLSARDSMTYFGLGKEPPADVTVEVIWPDGLRETFTVAIDRESVVERGAGLSVLDSP